LEHRAEYLARTIRRILLREFTYTAARSSTATWSHTTQ
jgi:hypothetical protein